MLNKSLTIMTYLPYIYLIVFLLVAFIGMVRVFVFKNYIYAYTFFSALTVCHATKKAVELVEK